MVLTQAAPWILLRGLTREAGHWGAFEPLLRQAVAPHAVLTPDLPAMASVGPNAARPPCLR